ncbi:protein of unknown function [Chryseobacterium sp. RU37D]|uniref:DUF4421 family protein n=1 Tax=Chryseobacterium sp. RU37D TaxID=1907397 RepID=UPI00095433B0|nr:DUF4421 family protein [Chryseobacterium sp. RU37D]SIQ08296.1 protein of unknown function [Chryseobacterium sp. RU37D]
MSENIKFLLLVFFFSIGISGQKEDTTKIISYENLVMVRANFDTNIEDFVTNFSEDGQKYKNQISLNNNINMYLSVDYRIISIMLGFAPRFFPGNNDNDLKGKSSYTDFKIRLFPGKLIQTLSYKNMKGFYLKNLGDIDPYWQEGRDPYIQFPELRIQSFSGNTAYSFNKDFSLAGIYYQREWQKESNGSFVPSLDYDLTYFRNKDDDLKNKETQFNLGLNLAYYYNWLIKDKINISPFAFAGIGGKWASFQEDLPNGERSEKDKNKYFTHKFGGGIHIGYNTKKFLFGGKLNYMSYNYKLDPESSLYNNNLYGLIYIGYRFAPPKAVKNTYDKIKNKIPIL